MKWTYFFLLCVLSISGFSQDFQKEINDQVWKPFILSFNNYDANGFLAVHTKDVVRSPLDAKMILTYDEYLQNQLEGRKAATHARWIFVSQNVSPMPPRPLTLVYLR
jgi:hypothetical protein